MSDLFVIQVNGSWVLAHQAREATGFWQRGWGWMLHPRPHPGHALVFKGTSSLHTWFMRFRLDMVFLDEAQRVVALRAGVPGFWGGCGPRGTRWAVEMPSDPAFARLRVGDRLRFVRGGDTPV